MDAAESKLVPGYRLDRYELLCPIATGGMATVWLGRLRGTRGFEKYFAIKTIRTELIADPNFQEMFLDEARIASRILHQNVAQIVELGEQDDVLYLVMEFVEGDSLAKILRIAGKRGFRMPIGVSLRIIADVCDGLQAAHELRDERGERLGVVHRDVSPQNILVAAAGIAKVIDFGLVKARNRSAAETQSGIVKGKIRYMAPEQISGRQIDHRADVWAAGMCLYELVCGVVPYDNEDDLDVLRRLTSENPLPAFDPSLPRQLNDLLARAITKDPAARFPTCAAMRRAIDQTAAELRFPYSTDAVADFLRRNLPELASKRADTIAHAVANVEARPLSHAPPSGSARIGQLPTMDAFAATEIGRLGGSDPSRSYPQASTASLRAQLGEQRRGGGVYFAAGLAAAGLAAFLLWPRHPPATPTPAASARPADAPPPATTPTPAPTPSAIELPPATPSSAAAPSATPARPAPGPQRGGRPAGPAPTSMAPAVDGGLSPGAQAAAAVMLAPKSTESPAPEEPK